MTDRQPTEITNLDRYGGGTVPWDVPRDLLAHGHKGPLVGFFLDTVRPDGRPHAAGIGAVWHDGDPSAGPPPWHLYRFTFHTVVGLRTEEPNGATRWRF